MKIFARFARCISESKATERTAIRDKANNINSNKNRVTANLKHIFNGLGVACLVASAIWFKTEIYDNAPVTMIDSFGLSTELYAHALADVLNGMDTNNILSQSLKLSVGVTALQHDYVVKMLGLNLTPESKNLLAEYKQGLERLQTLLAHEPIKPEIKVEINRLFFYRDCFVIALNGRFPLHNPDYWLINKNLDIILQR